MKKALICGVSGQDGAYLSQYLLKKGYKVLGGSRDAQSNSFHNLESLGIKKEVEFISINLIDFRSTLQTIMKLKPDEIYNLSGQSSVGLSFEQPVETLESIVNGTLNILEAIRFSDIDIKFYNAGSSECFGDTSQEPADESSSFFPQSPYAIAKSTAYWLVHNYRESYKINACTGILFNHESPLRPARYVTKKIVAAACNIRQGNQQKLKLGNIDIVRDWGWAPDYVEAMWLMLQREDLEEFVIATGESNSLLDFVNETFQYLGLDYSEYLETDNTLLRPSDLKIGSANPIKAKLKLGWTANYKMKNVVEKMVDYELSGSKD